MSKQHNEDSSNLSEYDHLLNTGLSMSDVKEHILGPAISILFHLALLPALAFIIVMEPQKEKEDVEVEMVELDMKEIEEPPPPPEVQEETTDEEVEVDVETPDVSPPTPEAAPASSIEITDANMQINLSGAISSLDNGSNLKIDLTGLVRTNKKGGSAFGYGDSLKGDLIGDVWDLKRDSKGKPRNWSYGGDVKKLIDGKFGKSTGIMKIKKRLFMSHLFIPPTPATEGPKQFGVEKEMEPKGFLIHYKGFLAAPHDGEFRFVGQGDDCLIIMIDGKVVQEGSWGMSISGWHPTEEVEKYKNFNEQYLNFGDWVKLRKGVKHRIDVLFGENPGGAISVNLLIQEKGKKYETWGDDNKPKLPVFALQNLTPKERARLEKSTVWQFDMNIPNFNPDKKKKRDLTKELNICW